MLRMGLIGTRHPGTGAADKATALFQCYLCIATSTGNTQSRAGAPLFPLFNNGDLAMQGTDYPGAPSAAAGAREIRLSCYANTNCPECLKAGIETAVGVICSPESA